MDNQSQVQVWTGSVNMEQCKLISFYNHSMSGNKVVKPAIDIELVALILKDWVLVTDSVVIFI